MAQFRVEFLLDQASGKYLAELYNPDNANELIARTEALYPSQAAAVMGVLQLFKNALFQFPKPDSEPKVIGKPKAKKKASKKKKPTKKKPPTKKKKPTKRKK